jgi:hypothetical protein
MNRFRFNEGSIGTISGQLLNGEGLPFPPTVVVNFVTASLIDVESLDLTVSPVRGVINGLLNADLTDRIIVDTTFRWSLTLMPEENTILNSRRQLERHRAIFMFTGTVPGTELYAKPTPNEGQIVTEVEIEVVNLDTVS